MLQPPESNSGHPTEANTDPLPDQSQNLSEQKLGPPLLNPKPAQLLSVGRVIERRWHCLWLKSLEWQCFLEQLTWTPKLRKKASKISPTIEFPKFRITNISWS